MYRKSNIVTIELDAKSHYHGQVMVYCSRECDADLNIPDENKVALDTFVAQIIRKKYNVKTTRRCITCDVFVATSLKANLLAHISYGYRCLKCRNSHEIKPIIHRTAMCSNCLTPTPCATGSYMPWAKSCYSPRIYKFFCNSCQWSFYEGL